MTHREKRSSAKNQTGAQVACYERFGHDCLVAEYGLWGVGQAVGKAYDNPCGYTISIGCDILIGTSLENMDFLMEASRYYGKMPLDIKKFK